MIEITMKNQRRFQIDPRRIPELRDARMIQEDERAIANLPTEPIHVEFHKNNYYDNPYSDYSAVTPIPPRGFKNHG